MPNNRLEYHYSMLWEIMMGFVYPLLTGGLGAMGLFVAISVHTDPLDIFISILLSGFFWTRDIDKTLGRYTCNLIPARPSLQLRS
jgi:hypothetical protein